MDTVIDAVELIADGSPPRIAQDESRATYDPLCRDELVLAVPLNPLCDDGCRGLCPLCGNNRNLVPCKHAAATPAAPGGLAALGKIKL